MRVGIMGAGAIGCYVGGRLAAAGHDVVLIGREPLQALHVSDYRGFDQHVPVRVETDPAALAGAEIIVIAVKGFDTESAATQLAKVLKPDQAVVSLQNGVRNVSVLRTLLAKNQVLAGMVQFNVVRTDPARVHCAMNGRIAIEDAPVARRLAEALRAAGIDAVADPQVTAVQWGKLILNLNNAVNALAGVPLRTMLATRDYRLVMAAVIEEAVGTLKAARIAAKLPIPLPPALLPGVLRLPTPLFKLAAKSMLAVDPQAKSSMADDLERRRRTEIDALNGEIVRLAAAHGRKAPANAAIVRLVQAAEAAKSGSPALSAAALQQNLREPS
jgi:2-dehydropantoate 2-reductase